MATQLRNNTPELEQGPRAGYATQQGTAAYAQILIDEGAHPSHFRTLSLPGARGS